MRELNDGNIPSASDYDISNGEFWDIIDACQDAEYIKAWLSHPSVRNAFPMFSEWEVDDAVRRWISFFRLKGGLTVEKHGRPIGNATLYIQSYCRLKHQAEFGIILDENHRHQGVGSFLLSSLLKLAKLQFHIELIHLQVYQDNPAIKLYKKFGFIEYGFQKKWIKEEEGKYVGRLFMEREL